MRVVGEQRDEGLLVRRRVGTHERQHELGGGGLRVVPEPEEDDHHVEVAERHQLCEALRRRPLVQPGRVAQPLAELVFLKVCDVQDGGELLRLGLAHLGGRVATEEHRDLLVQINQVLDEAQQPHVAPHRLEVLLVHDQDPVAREVARCLTAVFGAGVGVQRGHKCKGLGRNHVTGLVGVPPANRRRGSRLSGHGSCGCGCSSGGCRCGFARCSGNQPGIVLQVESALQQHEHDGQQADGRPRSPRR